MAPCFIVGLTTESLQFRLKVAATDGLVFFGLFWKFVPSPHHGSIETIVAAPSLVCAIWLNTEK